jgi:D-inositol-3-phosphate glycosyltransferase
MLAGSVAFICRSVYFRGAERNIFRIIMRCQGIGIHTILIASANNPLSRAIDNEGIYIFHTASVRKRLEVKSIRQIKKILKEKRTKAIIVFTSNDIYAGVLIKILSGFKIKLIFYQQESLNFKKNGLFYSLLFKWVDKWITPADYIRMEALNHRWISRQNIDVISHNLNLESFNKNFPSKEKAREELDLPMDKKIIGVLGRLNPQKNQDFLIRAINFLKLNHYDLELLIMGEPKREEEKVYSGFLRELMCECDLQDHIHFRNFSESKLTFFRAVDVFIMTTSGETCDVNLIYSMAAKTPVLSVQSEYNSEILEKGNLGILYKENDLEDFSAKIIKLLNHSKLYNYLQNEGRKAVFEKYDLNSKGYKFEEMISEFLNK